MSVYGTQVPIPSTAPGQATTVWNAETPAPGNGTTAASQQVGLSTNPRSGASPFGVDGKFSGAPGAFEIDIQIAATDADTQYQTISGGNITSVDSVNNTFHLDAPSCIGRYVRLLLRSRTNGVSVTATITGG